MPLIHSEQSTSCSAPQLARSTTLKNTSYRAALAAAFGILASAFAPQTWAQTTDALYTRSLSASCANCHGTNGKAVEGSAVVGLAGVPADYIVAQMNAFKTGARPATIMHQIAKGYSDAQIAQIAAYFAAQKK